MKKQGDILAVIGAQYGSEGKGNFVHKIAKDYGVHVRVGGPNAGHSFKHHGYTYKMQSVPCGWTNLEAMLVIGAGALILVEQLATEWRLLKQQGADITNRMMIDVKAGIISSWHHAKAGGVEGKDHKAYGSTGEGVGIARASRIMDRGIAVAREQGNSGGPIGGFYRAGDLPLDQVPADFRAAWKAMLHPDTAAYLRLEQQGGTNILLEGTQGSALSLIHGPWPYTSNHDSNAAQLAADCGLPPRLVNRCLLVMRTMPIRVAGNSGPLKGEKTWEDISKQVGRAVTEQTTVTKKTRRIGEWDPALIDDAVKLNAPTSIAISFLDYLSPEDEGVIEPTALSEKSWRFIEYVQGITGVPVLMAGTGGKEEWAVIKLPQAGKPEWRL